MVIKKRGSKFYCRCVQCNKVIKFNREHDALNAIRRGNCKNCYRINRTRRIEDAFDGKITAHNGRWRVDCPTCRCERYYARLYHARATLLSNRDCRSCSTSKRQPSDYLYSKNIRIYLFKKFMRSAIGRNLDWRIEISHLVDLWDAQGGRCALSGIKLSDKRFEETYSLDRIDSTKGYHPDNVQLVHKTINMMKGSLKDEDFRLWCRRVSRCQIKSV